MNEPQYFGEVEDDAMVHLGPLEGEDAQDRLAGRRHVYREYRAGCGKTASVKFEE
jgi:hypothetical protein